MQNGPSNSFPLVRGPLVNSIDSLLRLRPNVALLLLKRQKELLIFVRL